MPTSANPSDVCADVGIRAPILALSQQPLAKPGRVRCARGVAAPARRRQGEEIARIARWKGLFSALLGNDSRVLFLKSWLRKPVARCGCFRQAGF